MPLWDQTGTPVMPLDGFFHFRSSTISGSACLMRVRIRESISSRQLPGSISFDRGAAFFHGLSFPLLMTRSLYHGRKSDVVRHSLRPSQHREEAALLRRGNPDARPGHRRERGNLHGGQRRAPAAAPLPAAGAIDDGVDPQ